MPVETISLLIDGQDEIYGHQSRKSKSRDQMISGRLARYSLLSKIQSTFLLATSAFFDTMRRDRQILNRRESEVRLVCSGSFRLRPCT